MCQNSWNIEIRDCLSMSWTSLLTKIVKFVLNSDMQFTLQKVTSWSVVDISNISWIAAPFWLDVVIDSKVGCVAFTLIEVKHRNFCNSYLQLFWVSVLCILRHISIDETQTLQYYDAKEPHQIVHACTIGRFWRRILIL